MKSLKGNNSDKTAASPLMSEPEAGIWSQRTGCGFYCTIIISIVKMTFCGRISSDTEVDQQLCQHHGSDTQDHADGDIKHPDGSAAVFQKLRRFK